MGPLIGSEGADFLRGGKGDDHIEGRVGDDELYGGEGNNYLEGGDGNDRFYAGSGDDILLGGAGDDELHGGPGNDRLEGGGSSELRWKNLDDLPQDPYFESWERLYGGPGDDILLGGGGDDRLEGGLGDDRLEGGEGDDFLYYEDRSGADRLLGGPGNDAFIFSEEDTATDLPRDVGGVALIDGGEGYDTIVLTDFRLVESGLVYDFTADSNPMDNEGKIRNIEVIAIDGSATEYVLLVEHMDFTKLRIRILYSDDRHDAFPTVAARGTSGNNVILGFTKIDGGAGDDMLGGTVLFGGSGDDQLHGVKLTGGPGTDVLSGRGSTNEFLFFTRGWGRQVTDVAVGDVLVFYDLDPSSLRQISGDHGYEIRYGEGDIVTFDGVATIEYQYATVGDVRRNNGSEFPFMSRVSFGSFVYSYFEQYGLDGDSYRLNDNCFDGIVNDHDVDDVILIINAVHNNKIQ